MRTTASIKLLPAEMTMVRESAKTLSENLTGWNKKLFDGTALKRVIEAKENLLMDGMELKLVSQALNKQGWIYFYSGKKVKAKTYFELAQWIKEERVKFQEENGPKIKTAISAGTLTAAI
jgi:hypothetical protein